MMIANFARQAAVASRFEIATVAMKTVKDDKNLSKLFDWIFLYIDTAVDGGNFGTDFYQEDMYKKFPFTRKDSSWVSLLVDMGYKIDTSGSSNPINERYFVKF